MTPDDASETVPGAAPPLDAPPLDAAALRMIGGRRHGPAGRRQGRIVAALAPVIGETLAAHGLDTRLRQAHFLAQTAHESDGFSTTEEYASGAAYEGRRDLGNTAPGDGVRFKGRGLIQLTGRANYARFGALAGLDLIGAPERAAEPLPSLTLACLYWRARDLNDPAGRDDLPGVTRGVNGGLNGLADRRACLARAKAVLGLPPAHRPLLRRGARGAAVLRLQTALAARGMALEADARFGPETEARLRDWQATRGLANDGVAGPATWAALGL